MCVNVQCTFYNVECTLYNLHYTVVYIGVQQFSVVTLMNDDIHIKIHDNTK